MNQQRQQKTQTNNNIHSSGEMVVMIVTVLPLTVTVVLTRLGFTPKPLTTKYEQTNRHTHDSTPCNAVVDLRNECWNRIRVVVEVVDGVCRSWHCDGDCYISAGSSSSHCVFVLQREHIHTKHKHKSTNTTNANSRNIPTAAHFPAESTTIVPEHVVHAVDEHSVQPVLNVVHATKKINKMRMSTSTNTPWHLLLLSDHSPVPHAATHLLLISVYGVERVQPNQTNNERRTQTTTHEQTDIPEATHAVASVDPAGDVSPDGQFVHVVESASE